MIAAFLLPFPFRGYRAPYLWVYYRLLSSFGERMLFITSRDYVQPPDYWMQQNRWEVLSGNAQRLQYHVPAPEEMAKHEYGFLPEATFETLLAESGGNPLAAFSRLLSERVPCLESDFANLLPQSPSVEVEAILTWCNCPSLAALATERGIPLVHLEIGPLRWPHFRPTAYLDFSGVNGNTEAAQRYRNSGLRKAENQLEINSMCRFFMPHMDRQWPSNRYRLGVALQVEDDSNLLAFGRGFDNLSLLTFAHLRHPEGGVLARGHPGSVFALKSDWYVLDDSLDSLMFIHRCEKILTINSSVGLEALLIQIPVEILGDCAHRFIAETDDDAERALRLAFYLFAYLVPMQLSLDPDYLRFRLRKPSEFEIVIRHLAAYGLDCEKLRQDSEGSLLRLFELALSDAFS